MKSLIFSLLCCVFVQLLSAQVTGTIKDMAGQPLPFASIYIKGTSTGTTSNVEGVFEFNPPIGKHTLVFQYIGFRTQAREIDYRGNRLEVDVMLEEEEIELSEITVRADAEDPAYAIIRKAIEKRKYYRDLVEAYSCDVYIKGTHRLLDAPEKFFGQELGNLGGILDSNRQGIIYLSESESELHVQRPGHYREIMRSSRVSGNDNGFSFNRASLMDFNFYENSIDIDRSIISPIGNTALAYYEFKLEGTFLDNDGRLINKIRVTPKRVEEPTFTGFIYIVEDLWNIHSVDLFITGATIKQPVLDTLMIRQVHVPVQEPEKWMLLSQTLDFGFSIFKFKVQGFFTGLFSDYDLEPSFGEDFFSGEVFFVEEGANEKERAYWDTIRPIPLTVEEEEDYVRKDTLQKIWKSKEFLDSMDRKSNKFKVFDVLFGYSYERSFYRESFTIEPPTNTIQFNAVQGWRGSLNLEYRKVFDEENTRWFSIAPGLNYGFADKQIRASGRAIVNLDEIHFTTLEIEGGRKAVQFNEEEPISPMLNTLYSLFGKENYLRLYDKYYGRLAFRRELINGLYLEAGAEYAERRALFNKTNYSISKKREEYAPNNPFDPGAEEPVGFDTHQALLLDLGLRIRINQKYLSFPKRRVLMGSDLPTLWVRYRKGIAAFDGDVNYDLLSLSISDRYDIGLTGELQFNIEGGTFINDARVEFMDLKHFNGNQTSVASTADYLNSFLLLPYYDYSTAGNFAQIHAEHHFEGFLLDKVPLIRKLGWKLVAGGSFLFTEGRQNYFELNTGIENIGFGIFRLVRLDLVHSFAGGAYQKSAVVVGLGF